MNLSSVQAHQGYSGLQRDFAAAVVAYKMDPARRELYVEGQCDRLFFDWLFGHERDPDLHILEIDKIIITENVLGGCRGRLLWFAGQTLHLKPRLRCFVDADFDRLLKRNCPENVWFTDRRDLEGYFLNTDSMRKVLQLAASVDCLKPGQVLENVMRVGRQLGVLRLCSEKHDLKLPFQKCPPDRYLTRCEDRITLEFERYVRALLQDAHIGLRKMAAILEQYRIVLEETTDEVDEQLVHGKDAIAILECLLDSPKFKKAAVEGACRVSMERPTLFGFPNIVAVYSYACKSVPCQKLAKPVQ